MHHSHVTGQNAENLALTYLQQQNLRLVKRNFHSRFGEIDLIMEDSDSLVFVEVKHRQAGLNHAIESINYSKQQKLIKTAQYYLLKYNLDAACRFDAVVFDNNQIEWLKNIIIL